MMSTNEVDDVLARTGGFGRYQVLLYVALGLVNMRGAWHVFVSMFVGWPVEHYCTPRANHTLNESLPWVENDYGEMAWSQCSMYQDPGSEGVPHGNTTVSCQLGWTYVWDREGETSTASDWDLVCDKTYLSELSLTIYMVGATCGTLFLTPLSDRWGRKTVMMACILLQAAVGVGISLTQGPVAFIVLQFFIGICNMTVALCAYVLVVETFDKDTRELPALSLQFFWAGGIMLLSLLAYLLPKWRHLQLAVSLPQILAVSFFWLLPESLTWLLIKGKIQRARDVILSMVRVNKLPPFDNLDETLDRFKGGLPTRQGGDVVLQQAPAAGEATKEKGLNGAVVVASTTHTVLDLFKTPRLRRYSIFMFYLYLVNSLAYFGISFSMPLLSGDKYINMLISGAVEIPAYIVCIICNRRIGRRWPICVFLVICAAANIIIIFLPATTASGADLTDLKTALVMVGKFGITGSYSALYLYGSEIFPTSIRNHAVGLCSFFENIGSIVAPQIVYAAKTITELPMTVFSVMALLGSILVIFLPETHNAPLPQTVDDVELWEERQRYQYKLKAGKAENTEVAANEDKSISIISSRKTASTVI